MISEQDIEAIRKKFKGNKSEVPVAETKKSVEIELPFNFKNRIPEGYRLRKGAIVDERST